VHTCIVFTKAYYVNVSCIIRSLGCGWSRRFLLATQEELSLERDNGDALVIHGMSLRQQNETNERAHALAEDREAHH
jgi:hypothetical protein